LGPGPADQGEVDVVDLALLLHTRGAALALEQGGGGAVRLLGGLTQGALGEQGQGGRPDRFGPAAREGGGAVGACVAAAGFGGGGGGVGVFVGAGEGQQRQAGGLQGGGLVGGVAPAALRVGLVHEGLQGGVAVDHGQPSAVRNCSWSFV